MVIGLITLFIVVANFIVIFGNTHTLHTSNKPIWMYDLFALLFWITNICSWLATYWDIIKDNSIVHLSFFFTPLILMVWGTIVISGVKEILVSSLWQLFLVSYISSIIVSTLFILFIVQEVRRIREEEDQGIITEEHDGVIRGTYKLMTNSGEFLLNQQQNQMLPPLTRPPPPPQHFVQTNPQNNPNPYGRQQAQPQGNYTRLPTQDHTDNTYF
jgi:hypothetical protein